MAGTSFLHCADIMVFEPATAVRLLAPTTYAIDLFHYWCISSSMFIVLLLFFSISIPFCLAG